uniref:Uncharacterized protein n=1 Tax=Anguilla anguilla TaxID=7936 RepID=A0A0E9S646_ANGAN
MADTDTPTPKILPLVLSDNCEMQ